jgi:endonuclease/exonuclease/phosphatase (EEP) superfamily protein YafD
VPRESSDKVRKESLIPQIVVMNQTETLVIALTSDNVQQDLDTTTRGISPIEDQILRNSCCSIIILASIKLISAEGMNINYA